MSEPARQLRVAVTGASGLIGKRVVEDLRKGGHVVYPLRREGAASGEATWNTETGAFSTPEPADVVLHLAGKSVATRWTPRARAEIQESRVQATEKLSRFLAGMGAAERPRLFLSASAVGIYGSRGEEVLTEASPPAPAKASFLADVCRGWEAATKPAEEAGIRVIHLRFGVVLAKEGGALAKMLLPTMLGLAGPIGPATQFMPWISLADVSRLVRFLMETDSGVAGPVNVVSPNPVRQHEFMRTLAAVLHRPAVFPMPSAVVKLLFGQMGEETLLASQRVLPTRIPEGFRFEHPTLEAALRAELA
ncbi:MAG: TIGR01777 family oxidoreductase [Phycisphaerae bacterium]